MVRVARKRLGQVSRGVAVQGLNARRDKALAFYTWALCNYNQRGGGWNAVEVDDLGPCDLQVGVFEA